MECVERGVLGPEETDGLDLTWGNADAVMEMLEKIARREGLGDLLAEGVKIASERVEGGQLAVGRASQGPGDVAGGGAQRHGLRLGLRGKPPGARPPAHRGARRVRYQPPGGAPWSRKITGDEKYATPYSTKKRAELVRWHEDCYAATEGLGMCVFTSTARYGVTPDHLAKLFSAIVGVDVSTDELMLAGRRTVYLGALL